MAAPTCHETTVMRNGKKVPAFSRTFKLEKVNGRQWLKKSNQGNESVRIPATVQVKTTVREAVGQLAQRAAGRLFSVYCYQSGKKVGSVPQFKFVKLPNVSLMTAKKLTNTMLAVC